MVVQDGLGIIEIAVKLSMKLSKLLHVGIGLEPVELEWIFILKLLN